MKYNFNYFVNLPHLLNFMLIEILDLLLYLFFTSGGSIIMNGVIIASKMTGIAIPA